MTLAIHGLDPGPVRSAIVSLYANGRVTSRIALNADVLAHVWDQASYPDPAVLVIEKIASYGMAVGEEVFDTVYWSGRFAEAWERQNANPVQRIPRMAVKMALCHNSRAKDTNIRQALIDAYGGPLAVKKGGPLHGIKADMWAALAVGWTYRQSLQQESRA